MVKIVFKTYAAVPRIFSFCGCSPILYKKHNTLTLVYKDVKLTEWSGVFTDMLTLKITAKDTFKDQLKKQIVRYSATYFPMFYTLFYYYLTI